MTAEYAFARVSDEEAEAAANDLVSPPLPDSPTFRAYRLGTFDAHAAVSWEHPNAVKPGQYSRRRVAIGRAFSKERVR